MEKFGQEVDEITPKRCERFRHLFVRIEFYQLLRQACFVGIVNMDHCKNMSLACSLQYGMVELKSGPGCSVYSTNMLKELIVRLERSNKRKRIKIIV